MYFWWSLKNIWILVTERGNISLKLYKHFYNNKHFVVGTGSRRSRRHWFNTHIYTVHTDGTVDCYTMLPRYSSLLWYTVFVCVNLYHHHRHPILLSYCTRRKLCVCILLTRSLAVNFHVCAFHSFFNLIYALEKVTEYSLEEGTVSKHEGSISERGI